MNHRAFFAIIAVLAFTVFFISTAFSPTLSLHGWAYAQINPSVAFGPANSVSRANSAPEFPASETGVRAVDENTPWYQNIGAPVTATDDNNDRLTYSLENAGTSHFTIVRSTGQLQVGAPLDYETRSSYTVTVKVSDPSGATDTITVTINVSNVDEPGTVSLYWGQPQVGTALEASLTDPDGSVSGVTWSWHRSSNRSTWTAISGATSATYTPVASDAANPRKYLRATASYTDGHGSSKTARAVSSRRVRTAPSNNRAPAFSSHSDTDLTARKTTPPGTKLYNSVYAEDPDRDDVRYSLEGADAGSFDIDASTGHVLTKVSLLDVDKSEYTVTVRAKDPSGISDTIAVTITVIGSRETPVVKGPKEIRYPENGSWQVGTYTATNPRGPVRGWIVSVNPGGGDGNFFHIDDDGVLTFDSPPDYEDPADDNTNNEYTFTIMAYDTNPAQGERPGQSHYSVKVIVTDVDDALVSGPSAVDYPENSDGPVGHYTVTAPEGANVTVSLSGDDRGDFSWNNGVLSFRTSPDHEAPADDDGDNVYHVTIEASDGELTNSLDVAVTVTDENEPPVISGRPSVSYPENSTSTVATYTATDPEKGQITWSLAGDDSNDFFINSTDNATGELTFRSPPDYEAPADADENNIYKVTVQALDGANTATLEVTVTVTGVNEAPAFARETDTRTVDENTPAGQGIGAPVEATEQDTGDTLTYTLGGTDAASFSIVADSGQLQAKAPLDYETGRTNYTVTVTATDQVRRV